MPMEFDYATAIITDPKNKILLQKKDSGYKWGPNKWCTWGGSIEQGETPEQAIKREIFEELGFEPGDYSLKFIGDYLYEGILMNTPVKMNHRVFLVKFGGDLDKIKLGEGGGFALFEEEELKDLNLLETSKILLEKFKLKYKMIPVCKPYLPGNEKKYVYEAIGTNWISSSGKYINEFEKEFSRFCNTEHGVSCSNGFGALHLACLAIGLKKGDEVIVPNFTMSAPLNAVILTGAKPVLIDCDRETFCINPEKIEEKINPNTKAIIAVHIYGHPCEMDKINEIAKKYNIYVIEDAAEAHGSEYNGKKCGSMGDIGCFSFYANKILTTGEGGMAITNNPIFAEKMKKLRNYAFEVPRFLHRELGFNYRLTNIQAAIGLAQTENAETLVNLRRNIGKKYNEKLKGVKGIILPTEKENCKNVYWMYGIVLEDVINSTREEITQKLREKGVDTRDFFTPMNKQPIFTEPNLENAPDCSGDFFISEKIGKRGFYLPSSSDLTDEEIEIICNNLKEVLINEINDQNTK